MNMHTSRLSMLRDAFAVAVIAVLTVQGLRRWYGDRYLVPSDSMQPVLYGDPYRGDVVFVDKLVHAASRRRGDLVVVENPTMAGHQLVKRIAACGDEKGKQWLDIRKGDIWLGDSPQHMQREVKEPLVAMSRSVTWGMAGGDSEPASVFDLRAAIGDGPWLLPPVASMLANVRATFRRRAHRSRHKNPERGVLPSGVIGTNRSVDATFIDAMGQRSLSGDAFAVTDCGLEFVVNKQVGVLLCSIDSTDFTTTFVWNARGNTISVWLDGRSILDKNSVLTSEWQGKVTFARLDGRDFIMLDDDHVLAISTPGQVNRPHTWLHVGVVGDQPAAITSLRAFRDVFAYRQRLLSVGSVAEWPRRVDPGHWFLLGDNAFDSRDSRQIGAVATSKFLGVPTCVIGPWSRARMLTP